MNTVDVVTNLEIQKVPAEGDRIELHTMDSLFSEIESHVVPVSRVCRTGHPDLFIAYSPQVEEKLGVPIRAILREAEASRLAWNSARDHMLRLQNRITEARFLDRLKYLFTRKL